MDVFLSYSFREERRAAAIQAEVRSRGYQIDGFTHTDLVDERYDFLRECTTCVVLFSPQSLVTESVRLSLRLEKAACKNLILVDEDWDQDPQAASVFRKFDVERIAFRCDVIVRRLIRLFDGFGRDDKIAACGDEHFDPAAMRGKVTTLDLLTGGAGLSDRRPTLDELLKGSPRPGVFGKPKRDDSKISSHFDSRTPDLRSKTPKPDSD